MALKPKTLKKIREAIHRFSAWLKYRALGPQALTKEELKMLARDGLIGPNNAPRQAVSRSYIDTHKQIAPTPSPKATRDGALEFLERMFARYADKLGEQMATDVAAQAEAHVMPFADRTEGKHIYEALKDKSAVSKNLVKELRGRVKDWEHRWKTIVDTELTRAAQFGALDAILHNNQGKDPSDITVAKVGPLDGDTCAECRRFWYAEGGNPRVYRLSELLANGTNMGKKRVDWLPVIDNTHPLERHRLIEVRPGWGFENGRLSWKGKDHDEHDHQRGSSSR